MKKYITKQSGIKGAGKGLFTNASFKKGEVIGLAHVDDQPASEIGRNHNHNEKNPTAYSKKIDNKRYIYASKDLKPGEEITTNYRMQPELEQPEDFMRKGGSVLRLPNKKNSKGYSRSLSATNKLFTQNFLFAKPKSRKNKVFDPNAKYYAEGGEYEDAELTPEEIEEYRANGYIVEEINEYDEGGNIGCPSGYVKNQLTGECVLENVRDIFNIEDPNKREQIVNSTGFGNQVDKNIDYYRDYMNSTRYKDMIINSAGPAAYKYSLARKNNLETIPSIRQKDIWNLTPGVHTRGRSFNNDGQIEIDKNFGYSPVVGQQQTLPHEISHSTDRPIDFYTYADSNAIYKHEDYNWYISNASSDNKWKKITDPKRVGNLYRGSILEEMERVIPPKDVNKITSYAATSYLNSPEFYRLSTEEKKRATTKYKNDKEYKTEHDNRIKYLSNPTETRARLNAARYAAKKTNLYDPFNQKIDKKAYLQLQDNDAIKDLKQIYSDEEIMEMMNTISKNADSGEKLNVAAQGGALNKFVNGGEPRCPEGEYWDGKNCVKLPKNAFVTSDPEEFAYRDQQFKDSTNLFNQSQKSSGLYSQRYGSLVSRGPYWRKVSEQPLSDGYKVPGRIQPVAQRITEATFPEYAYKQNGVWKFDGKKYMKRKKDVYAKPVQPVVFDKKEPVKPTTTIYLEKIENLPLLKPSLIQQQNYQLQGNTLNEEELELPNEEVESEYLEEGSPDTENSMEWVNKRKYDIDWNGIQIPYRLPRFRKPGSYGDLIKKGKQRYINLPTIKSRNTAYLREKQNGGALLTKEVTCKKCGWKWDAADGGNDITTCHKCGGQGLVHAQDGGKTDAMTGMMKARLAYANEFGNPAAKRMINIPDNPYQFDNGDTGSHYMASMDNYAVPQIQDENSELVLGDYGPESNEAIRFDSDEDANYFAKNYKDVSPGFIEADLDEDEIEEYRRGGYIVEEINEFQDGGIHTVAGSKGLYKKVNGKWQVDWNKSGKYQPLSKGDIKARTAILDKMAKPVNDGMSKISSNSFDNTRVNYQKPLIESFNRSNNLESFYKKEKEKDLQNQKDATAYHNKTNKISNNFTPKTKENLKNSPVIDNKYFNSLWKNPIPFPDGYKPQNTKLESIELLYPERYGIGPGGGLVGLGMKASKAAFAFKPISYLPSVGKALTYHSVYDAATEHVPNTVKLVSDKSEWNNDKSIDLFKNLFKITSTAAGFSKYDKLKYFNKIRNAGQFIDKTTDANKDALKGTKMLKNVVSTFKKYGGQQF